MKEQAYARTASSSTISSSHHSNGQHDTSTATALLVENNTIPPSAENMTTTTTNTTTSYSCNNVSVNGSTASSINTRANKDKTAELIKRTCKGCQARDCDLDLRPCGCSTHVVSEKEILHIHMFCHHCCLNCLLTYIFITFSFF